MLKRKHLRSRDDHGLFRQDIQADLLEANVHVKRQWLSRVADRGDAELAIG